MQSTSEPPIDRRIVANGQLSTCSSTCSGRVRFQDILGLPLHLASALRCSTGRNFGNRLVRRRAFAAHAAFPANRTTVRSHLLYKVSFSSCESSCVCVCLQADLRVLADPRPVVDSKCFLVRVHKQSKRGSSTSAQSEQDELRNKRQTKLFAMPIESKQLSCGASACSLKVRLACVRTRVNAIANRLCSCTSSGAVVELFVLY